jgi:uncharacterized protein YmfQ (DUF2313 family)
MIIEKRTQQEQARILANYLRDDKLHQAKNQKDSNLYKILVGLAEGWLDFRNNANAIVDNYNINNSLLLIEEWEKAVGIPDNIFDISGDIETRKRNILLKLAGSKAETKEQFERIGEILGFDIQVEPAFKYSRFTYTFPVLLLNEGSSPFVILVNINKSLKPNGFSFKFTFKFSIDSADILKLFFNKIKPSNTIIIFRYV